MKISENFDLRELVSINTYKRRGNAAIELLDPRLMPILEYLKKLFSDDERAYIVVNDWLWGGAYTESGFRDYDTDITETLNSQHRYGRAIDIKVKHRGKYLRSDEMFYKVRENYAELRKLGITTVEDYRKTAGKNRSWLHLDCRITDREDLYIV
jgi:hypothetical protein